MALVLSRDIDNNFEFNGTSDRITIADNKRVKQPNPSIVKNIPLKDPQSWGNKPEIEPSILAQTRY